jgi:steroid delta-isomerase-like uncharacterized protein
MSDSTSASVGLQDRAQAVIDMWNAHDAAGVVGFMTEDVVRIDFGTGERLEGQAAVREFIERLETTFSSDYRFELGLVIGGDDAVAVEWTMSGTNDGADEQLGLPATGRHFEIRGVSVGRRRDGRTAEERVYWNMADYLQQVGLVPSPEASSARA